MTPFLLDFLCEPVTKAPLQLVDAVSSADGNIVAGALLSPAGKRYPIVNGIPRFVDSVKTETVESLAANPERLKYLRKQCKADRAKLGDALCNAVAEVIRKRFMGNGTPYTPESAPKN